MFSKFPCGFKNRISQPLYKVFGPRATRWESKIPSTSNSPAASSLRGRGGGGKEELGRYEDGGS